MRIGREAVAPAVVEFLDRAEQAQVTFLNQVGQRQVAVAVAPRDVDHQPQVGLDQAPPHVLTVCDLPRRRSLVRARHQTRGELPARLPALLQGRGQRLFLGGGQQRDRADLAQVKRHPRVAQESLAPLRAPAIRPGRRRMLPSSLLAPRWIDATPLSPCPDLARAAQWDVLHLHACPSPSHHLRAGAPSIPIPARGRATPQPLLPSVSDATGKTRGIAHTGPRRPHGERTRSSARFAARGAPCVARSTQGRAGHGGKGA